MVFNPSALYANTNATIVDTIDYPLPSDVELMWTGFLIGGSIFAGAAVLELTSLSTVRSLVSTPEGMKLYATAWMHTAINHLILAPMTYMAGTRLFGSGAPVSLSQKLMSTLGVLVVHTIGYYFTHRAMHTKALWWAHRFHHRFNRYICPIAASAVTQTEYLFAYMVPFVVAGAFLQPLSQEAFIFGALFIGHVNNFLHTPWMENLSQRHSPWWWVGASDHFEHHRQLTNNYAAPTFNIDRLLGLAPKLERAIDRACDSVLGAAIGQSSTTKKAA